MNLNCGTNCRIYRSLGRRIYYNHSPQRISYSISFFLTRYTYLYCINVYVLYLLKEIFDNIIIQNGDVITIVTNTGTLYLHKFFRHITLYSLLYTHYSILYTCIYLLCVLLNICTFKKKSAHLVVMTQHLHRMCLVCLICFMLFFFVKLNVF